LVTLGERPPCCRGLPIHDECRPGLGSHDWEDDLFASVEGPGLEVTA
jgi:hypothetical protein